MRALTRIPLFVNHAWVQTLLTLGGSVLVLIAFDWVRDTVKDGTIPVWLGPVVIGTIFIILLVESAYEEWSNAEEKASKLQDVISEAATRRLEIGYDPTPRMSRDGNTKTVVVRVYNPRPTTIRDCEIRFLDLLSVEGSPPLNGIPADGVRFLWSLSDDPARKKYTLTPRTGAILNVAYKHKLYMNHWYPFIENGQTWQLPNGTYDLQVDLLSPDLPRPEGHSIRVHARDFDSFGLKPTPLPDVDEA